MSTPVVMPQMGESIAEGTIVRWIKKVGDAVDRDEPLFEISTDKVDAEIPSPASGTLLEIAVKEGETVAVNSVVATIGAQGEAVAAPVKAPTAAPPPAKNVPPAPQADGSPSKLTTAPAPEPEEMEIDLPESVVESAPGEFPRHRTSPLVRRIAKEHGVDLSKLTGTGIAGRVTKQDILGYLDRSGPSARPAITARPTAPAAPEAPAGSSAPSPSDVVPMSV